MLAQGELFEGLGALDVYAVSAVAVADLDAELLEFLGWLEIVVHFYMRNDKRKRILQNLC